MKNTSENEYEALRVSVADRHYGDVSKIVRAPTDIIDFFNAEPALDSGTLQTLFHELNCNLETSDTFNAYATLHFILSGFPATLQYHEDTKKKPGRSYTPVYASQGKLNYGFTNGANPLSFLDTTVDAISQNGVAELYQFDSITEEMLIKIIRDKKSYSWSRGFMFGYQTLKGNNVIGEKVKKEASVIADLALDLGVLATLYSNKEKYENIVNVKIDVSPLSKH